MKQRHTCIICKRKRYTEKMKKVFLNSWVCEDSKECSAHSDIEIAKKIIELYKKLKKLNKMHIFGK